MIGVEDKFEIRLMRHYAAKPIGDFIAWVSSAITVMLCFLTFYGAPRVYSGYETPQGIVILAFGGLCCLFSSGVLLVKCIRNDFWLPRSPGWLYGLTAFVVVIASLIGLLFPFKESPSYGAMAGTFSRGSSSCSAA